MITSCRKLGNPVMNPQRLEKKKSEGNICHVIPDEDWNKEILVSGMGNGQRKPEIHPD